MGAGASAGAATEQRDLDPGAAEQARIVFDWARCQFDVAMPPSVSDWVPDGVWSEAMLNINCNLLGQYARKWRDPTCAEATSAKLLKAAVGAGVEHASKLAVPVPAKIAGDVAVSAGKAAFAKARRAEWDDLVVPGLEDLVKFFNHEATSAGQRLRVELADARAGWCFSRRIGRARARRKHGTTHRRTSQVDARLSPMQCAELATRRRRIELAEASASNGRAAADDAAAGKAARLRLRELAATFFEKVDARAASAEDLFREARPREDDAPAALASLAAEVVPTLAFRTVAA